MLPTALLLFVLQLFTVSKANSLYYRVRDKPAILERSLSTIPERSLSTIQTFKKFWSPDAKQHNTENDHILDEIQLNERRRQSAQQLKESPLNKLDGNGNTPLMNAAIDNNVEQIEQLLLHGADPNVHRPNSKETALLLAAARGNVQAVRALAQDVDIDLNVQGSEGKTALYIACYDENVEIAECLLSKAADPEIADNYKQAPLQIAAVRGNLRLVQMILEYSKRHYRENFLRIVNQHSESESSALINAVRNMYVKITSLLLKNRADPNLQDQWGYTALHYAAINGNTAIIKELLAHGARADIVKSDSI